MKKQTGSKRSRNPVIRISSYEPVRLKPWWSPGKRPERENRDDCDIYLSYVSSMFVCMSGCCCLLCILGSWLGSYARVRQEMKDWKLLFYVKTRKLVLSKACMGAWGEDTIEETEVCDLFLYLVHIRKVVSASSLLNFCCSNYKHRGLSMNCIGSWHPKIIEDLPSNFFILLCFEVCFPNLFVFNFSFYQRIVSSAIIVGLLSILYRPLKLHFQPMTIFFGGFFRTISALSLLSHLLLWHSSLFYHNMMYHV